MSYVVVAVAAFLGGCEWMIAMKKRQYRRMEKTMLRYFEARPTQDRGPGSGTHFDGVTHGGGHGD